MQPLPGLPLVFFKQYLDQLCNPGTFSYKDAVHGPV